MTVRLLECLRGCCLENKMSWCVLMVLLHRCRAQLSDTQSPVCFGCKSMVCNPSITHLLLPSSSFPISFLLSLFPLLSYPRTNNPSTYLPSSICLSIHLSIHPFSFVVPPSIPSFFSVSSSAHTSMHHLLAHVLVEQIWAISYSSRML